MSKRSVFLTGSSGTVGGGVLEVLVADGGFDVFCLARGAESATRIAQSGGQVVRGDLGNEAGFAELRGQRDYHFIVHVAQAHYAKYGRDEIDALEERSVRHLETLCSPATRLMVFTSGVWSHGTGAGGGVIDDATPHRPFLAATKRAAMMTALTTQTAYPWAVLSPPSMVYGREGPLMDLARMLREERTIEVCDDESVLWSVIERCDLGRAFLALMHEGKPGDSFVVAEDDPVRVIDYYKTVAAAIGRGRIVRLPWAHWERTLGRDALEVARTSQPVDSSRFRQRTGWRAREKFLSSVGRFLC